MSKKYYYIGIALILFLLLSYFIAGMFQKKQEQTEDKASIDIKEEGEIDSVILVEELKKDLAKEKAQKVKLAKQAKQKKRLDFFNKWAEQNLQENSGKISLKQTIDLLLNFDNFQPQDIEGEFEPEGFYQKHFFQNKEAASNLLLALQVPAKNASPYWKYHYFKYDENKLFLLQSIKMENEPKVCYDGYQVFKSYNDSIISMDYGISGEEDCSNYRQFFLLRKDSIVQVANFCNFADIPAEGKKMEAKLKFLNSQIMLKVKYQVERERNGKRRFRNQRDLIMYDWKSESLSYEPDPDPAKAYLAKMLGNP